MTTTGRQVSLTDMYEARSGRALMSGIQALVRLAIDQRRLDDTRGFNTGVFVSGYEGSPLGGLDLELVRARRYLDEVGVVFSPGLNEELAATAVAGTQLLGELPRRRRDGVVGFWFGKNPGLDRAADAIRHGTMSGTMPLGGAVAWIGDDPSCKSSTLPSSSESMARSLGLPLLAPAGVSDMMRLGLHAVALSRFAGVWTALKIVPDIADGAAVVDVSLPADAIPLPDLAREAHPPVLVGPQSLAAEEHLHSVRLPRVADYARSVGFNATTFEPARPRRGVVASGMAYAATLRALENLGIDDAAKQRLGLRLVKIAMPWPMDPGELRHLVDGLDEVTVIEDKAPFIESQLKEALYGQLRQPVIAGKLDAAGKPLVPSYGSVSTELATQVLVRQLPEVELPPSAAARLEQLHRLEELHRTPSLDGAGRRANPELEVTALPARTPYFCSGCPHNVSTQAADDQLVGLGIGCHIMVALDAKGRGQLLGLTQMGGEGAQWTGLAPFTEDPHFFQNLGDGTFFHSGSLAVRAAVAAGVDITYKLLYNDAVAMTGGQRPEGRLDVPTLTRTLALEGVRRVVVTTPDPSLYEGVALDPIAEVRHRDELADVQAELGRTRGVTVLIHDDRCAAEERRLRKRGKLPTPEKRVWINQRVCEGCGDCGEKSTCLSVVPVQTEFGRKTAIHQGSCNQDYTCLKGDCPSFVVVTAGREHRRGAVDLPVALTPPSTARVPAEDTLIRMPGIGGTGVVTVSRILQMAAHVEGRWAAGLDQTGLAQKGGPVISDVRISGHPIEGAVQASNHTADLLLGLDLLGAADPGTLAVADPERTVAVINTALVATAAMVTNVDVVVPPTTQATSRVERVTRTGENAYVDAQWIAERLFADHMYTNMVLVGAAFQHGCIPLTEGSIEEAIRLNGTTADENVTAFRWGRAAILAPAAVHEVLSPPRQAAPTTPMAAKRLLGSVSVPEALGIVVERRVGDLVDYQDVGYAREYLHEVLSVAARELTACNDPDLPVAATYARNLYKLMAYKDEYEVARLHLDAVEAAALQDEFGADAKRDVMLQPPILKALGLRRKVHLGPAAQPAFRVLRAGRRLRGTRLDPFGRTEMRRTERRLVGEYRSLVSTSLSRLDPSTVRQVTAIAALPDMIRGFEDVKRANIAAFRARAAELQAALLAGETPAPEPDPQLRIAG